MRNTIVGGVVFLVACQPAAPSAPPVTAVDAGAPPPTQEPMAGEVSHSGPPPGPTDEASASPMPPPEPPPPAPVVPPRVRVGEPTFVGGGEVPGVASFLDRMKEPAAACVADYDPQTRGTIRVQFLVTLRARAEGVDVTDAGEFNDAMQKCLRNAIKGGRVKVPTADPTGVQFSFTFEDG
ncbi:MAG: hypothetical protein AAF715_32550 [Myxococcota bacterium]